MANAKRQISIFVNGQQAELTAKNLSAAYKQAYNELSRMVVGSDEYIKQLEKVSGIDAELQKHKQNLKGVQEGYSLTKAGLDSLVGVAAGAFAVEQIFAYGRELFNTAAQMELLDKKAKTVFGTSLPQITEEANKNAQAMGLTNSEYIAAAANIQDLLVPMGFQRDQAANISGELVNLSGALSEWSGGQRSAKEVSEILSGALLGERDALKGLGIDLQQTEIDAEIAARGLGSLTGESQKQAEATVTLDLIMRKSVDAQKAFAEGAGTLARQQAEAAAKTKEISERLSTLLLPVFNSLLGAAGGVVDFFSDLAEGIDGVVNPAKAAGEAFEEQSAAVNDLQKNLVPLLDRYDVLSTKQNLTADEQAELNTVIQKIGDIVPGAITSIDKYGNALTINAGKAREFVEAEKAKLKYLNQSAIQETEGAIREFESKILEIQKQIESGTTIVTTGAGFNKRLERVKLTGEQIQELQQEVRNLAELSKGAKGALDDLTGASLDIPQPAPGGGITKPGESGGGDGKDSDKAKKAAEKEKETREKLEEDLKEHLLRVQKIVQDNQEAERVSKLSADEQEIARINAKYQKEIELVQSKFSEQEAIKEAVLQLEAQRDAEIEEKKTEQREAAVEAEIEAYLEDQERIAEAKIEYEEGKREAEAEIKEAEQEALFTERELEIAMLQQHYDQLLTLASQYGINRTGLEEALRKKLAEVNEKYDKEGAKKQYEANQARLKALGDSFSALGDVVAATGELFAEEAGKSATVSKIFTLAKIAFDTASAISSLVAASSANPTNAVTFGAAGIVQYAVGIVRILANIAQAKKILSSAPAVPQKAEGGYLKYTGAQVVQQKAAGSYLNITAEQAAKQPWPPAWSPPAYLNTGGAPAIQQKSGGSYIDVTGATDNRIYHALHIPPPATGLLPSYPVVFTSRATGGPVLASERGAEYFVAAHDLANPRVADHVRMIENITSTRVQQFAEGGLNAAASTPLPQGATTTPPPAPAPPPIDPAIIENNTAAMNNLAAVLSGGIVAIIPDGTVTDINKRLKVIDDASGGFFS